MFGGKLPVPVYKPAPPRFIRDIDMPTVDLGFGHLSREPNTNYATRLLHYRQREHEFDSKVDEHAIGGKTKIIWGERFMKHTDSKYRKGEIQRRLTKKMEAYEVEVDKRREKLRELLSLEEQQYVWETIDTAQRGHEQKKIDMKIRCKQLQAKTEAARLQVVADKKLQQYMARSQEVRPILAQKHLEESKNCQLQQMRENESRREAERELDRFWTQVTIKEEETKKRREEQEAIERFNRTLGQLDILDKQIAGKKLLAQEEAKLALEERLELQKTEERLRKAEEDAESGAKAKRKQLAEDVQKQLQEQIAYKARKKAEERALENAYMQLSNLEMEREQAKLADYSNTFKAEMAMYRHHLEELRQEQKAQEEQMMQFMEDYRRSVEAKQDEQSCKQYMAKVELQKQVMEERAKQIEEKKRKEREILEKRQDEIDAMNKVLEFQSKLDDELKRQQVVAQDKYRDDLLKQIEYSKELVRREEEEIERQLALGKKEEEHFQKVIKELLNMDQYLGGSHPFRSRIETYACCCPQDKMVIKPKY